MKHPRLDHTIGTSLAAIAACTTHADVLWDNGLPDGIGAYSNSTSGVFGSRRTLLDDFIVPPGQVWTVEGLRHRSVYNSGKVGRGTNMEILLRVNDDDTPGAIQFEFDVTHYEEEGTGRVFFSRDEVEHWAEVAPVELGPGHYWWEATVVASENNFWLTATQRENECWVNYTDFNGLEPGTAQFGVASDVNWILEGSALEACAADLDGDANVGFGDLLLILAAWGECFHHSGCPEDIDDSGAVDFGDILAVLGAWGGPCAPAITGACCFDDATCDDVTHAVCLSEDGQFLGLETVCDDGCPGACCFDDGTCVDGVAEDACVAALGHFAGEAVRCDDVDCPLVPVGACCLDDGTCEEPVSEPNCALLDGRYQGDGTSCDDIECAELGPCGWIVDAPFVWSDDNCSTDNSCGIRPSNDVRWTVTIPDDGVWTFSTCGTDTDTFLFVDTVECCGTEHFNNDFCAPGSQLTLDLIAGQLVFVTVETRTPEDCGEFTLVVSSP